MQGFMLIGMAKKQIIMQAGRFFVITLLLTLVFNLKHINAQVDKHDKCQIRVLTFNIYHGEKHYKDTLGDDKSNIKIVAAIIDSLKPDLVALQEVDRNTRRANGNDLITLLAYKTKMLPLFGKAMDFDGGEYGGGILSRYAFVRTENHQLVGDDESEPRVALSALVQLPCGQPIRFVATHLDHTSEELRKSQVKQINQLFTQDSFPTILAGDLNAVPDSKSIKCMLTKWDLTSETLEPTIPANNPQFKIDYILYDKRTQWDLIKSEVVDTQGASDHCAVFSIVELTCEKGSNEFK